MKIENIAAPPPTHSPEMRYASLHRNIEAGLATDRTWADLTIVCLELGNTQEALEAYHRIEARGEKCRVEPELIRRRLIRRADAEISNTDHTNGVDRTGARGETQRVDEPTPFREEVLDAIRFLFYDHMPLTVIVATMTFPIVVGLGGFLTRDSASFLLPLIALVPALSVVGLVGALARRILVEASHGIDDAPTIPAPRQLVRESLRFLLDGTVLAAVLLGPSIVLGLLGTVGALPLASLFLFGFALLPMAMAIRQLSDDWRALSPNVLLPAVVRGGPQYAMAVGVIVGLFLPAIISGKLTFGSHVYLQLSVLGPLGVAPLFVSARLLGRVLDIRRRALRGLVGLPPARDGAQPVRVATAANRPSERPQSRRPEHPNARNEAPRTPFETQAGTLRSTVPGDEQKRRTSMTSPSHPEAGRRRAPNAGRAAAGRPGSGRRPATQARNAPPQPPRNADDVREARLRQALAKHAEARKSSKVAATRNGTRPQRGPNAAGQGRPPTRKQTGGEAQRPVSTRVRGERIPDLTKLPGVSVVRGKDRETMGAAAPTRAE